MSKRPPFILTQSLIPQHFLSRIMGAITWSKIKPVKNYLIKRFMDYYQIDLKEANEPNYQAYPDFKSFFIRTLKPETRPIISTPNSIASPVDGTLSQFGAIDPNQKLFQAKGFTYDLNELITNNNDLNKKFKNGAFLTLYLAPHNYHRVHMPLDGTLTQMIYVPGKLFSVNQQSVNHIPNLFTRNERVITIFNTNYGPLAVIFVGALFVGSISTVFQGQITPGLTRTIKTWDFSHKPLVFKKGAELGYFNFGSTVILLLGDKKIDWSPNLHPQANLKMGEFLGEFG